ncbi:MAG: NAD(P)/FAD-dependent oxidoreductase [Magnetococcales bacterium]|nr:NAD(P)/FAD-dependent oxidoreductase [Magnetococcales bacterium]
MDQAATPAFDAIIIGAGLGGLTAGALLAQAGRRVLILERHDKFGGAATTFRRRELQVEASLCAMDGLDAMDFKSSIFARLGLDATVPLATAETFYHLRHPLLGADFVMPRGHEAAIAACVARFPQQAQGIRTYFTTIRHLRDARNNQLIMQLQVGHTPLNALPSLGAHGAEGGAVTSPRPELLERGRKVSLGQFLRTLFGSDEAVKFALCANMYFTSGNLDHISIFDFALSQASYHHAAHYVRGGSQKLSDELARIIRAAGGELRARRVVTRILIDRGRAVGVEHAQAPVIGSNKPVRDPDPQQARAGVVIANATPAAVRDLLPAPQGQLFHHPYDGLPAFDSNWTLYLGFDKKPAHHGVNHYLNFVYPAWFDAVAKLPESGAVLGLPPGSKVPPFLFCDYSQLGEMITDSGQCLGVMSGLDRLANWRFPDEEGYRVHKERWLDALIVALDARFPGIAASIVYRELATPRTVRAYLNDPEGSIHGYGNPELMRIGRTLHKSPRSAVDSLLLASALIYGPGYSKAVLAGTVAAEAAFRELQSG